MVLCENVMIFQLLNESSTILYVQYVTGWYYGCCCCVGNQEPSVYIIWMYIKQSHRVLLVLRIFHVLVLDKIKYDNDYSTLWYDVVFCVDHKMTTVETCLYINHLEIFWLNIIFLLKIIPPLWPLLFNCHFFALYLINNSMFTFCIRQVFFKFLS